jgi:hypothetical protein
MKEVADLYIQKINGFVDEALTLPGGKIIACGNLNAVERDIALARKNDQLTEAEFTEVELHRQNSISNLS